MSNNGAGEPSWAWLGLLKWSLNYVDGTRPSGESMAKMTDERRAFLEKVMSEGIVDPGKRMKLLLAQLTSSLQHLSDGCSVNEKSTTPEEKEAESLVLDENGMVDALDELSDIVEQIDYARDFVKMNGLPFLLGCVSQEEGVPQRVRVGCLGILATVCQNNPPVQQNMLELDTLNLLAGVYAAEMDRDPNGKMRTKIVHVFSCLVRGQCAGEKTFSENEHCRAIVDRSLGCGGIDVPVILRRKAAFLLRALVCSDFSSKMRVQDFSRSIERIIEFVDPSVEKDTELREIAISLLVHILEQRLIVNVIVDNKERIIALGVKQLAELKPLPEGEEKDRLIFEIDLWETLITEFAQFQG